MKIVTEECMNFVIVGHLCYDEITRNDGSVVKGFGGIYYTVATLSVIAGSDHKIFPVFGVGKDREEELFEQLESYPNVVTDGIYTLNGRTNTVRLFYNDTQNRIECSENIAPPIPVMAVQPFVKRADAVLVNMISGFDITFETMYMINERKSSRSVPVYFDFHSLTLGVDENNARFRRPMMDWRRWAFYASIIQMNEEEAAHLTVERLDEMQLAKHMISLGPTAMVVTRGDQGCRVYSADKKRILATDVPLVQFEPDERALSHEKQLPDPTGCGDVFGAAYLYRYVQTGDVIDAAKYANRVASHRVTIERSEDLHQLAEVASRVT